MVTFPAVPRLDEPVTWTFIFAITGLPSCVPAKDKGFANKPLLGYSKDDTPFSIRVESEGLPLRRKAVENSVRPVSLAIGGGVAGKSWFTGEERKGVV